jgi:hypothetical protein
MKMQLKPYSKEVTSLKSAYQSWYMQLFISQKLKMINNWAIVRSLIGSMMTDTFNISTSNENHGHEFHPQCFQLVKWHLEMRKMMWAFE